MPIRHDMKGKKVITMRVLDATAVGALEDPPVSAEAIKKRLKRYPEGTDNAYPSPLPYLVNGGYVWTEEDIPKLRAWKGAGSGKGGGRPPRTANTTSTPATDAQTHAAGTGDTSRTDQPTPDPLAPLAPLRPINAQATGDVFLNLQRQKDDRDIWGTAGETFSFTSREVYREQAMSWLAENSELNNRTIQAADWNEVFDYFHGVRHGTASAPEPTPTPAPEPEPEPAPEPAQPFADRRLSDDPAHVGMTNIWQVIQYENEKAPEKWAAARRKAWLAKAMEAPTVTDPATAVKVHVDVVEPGKAVIVGPGFQGRVGIDTDAKSRRYWVELSESDQHPDDVEQIIGHARTYSATAEVLAKHHGLTNYYVDVEHEK